MKKYYMICCMVAAVHIINGAENPKPLTWNAKNYKENSLPQYHFAQYALSQISFDKEDIVLDVGCGDGKITRDIAKKVSKGLVMGIDNSIDMVQQAVWDHLEQENLCFMHTDIENFNNTLGRGTYKKVFASCSLSWVKDQEKAYKNIAGALGSGGKFVALVSDVDSPILQAYRVIFTHPRWESFFKNYNPSYYPSSQADVKRYLAQADLISLVVKKAEIPSIAMSRENFIKALAGTPGVKDVVPQEQYMDFLNDVVTEYLTKIPADAEGRIIIDSGLLLVVAEKPN